MTEEGTKSEPSLTAEQRVPEAVTIPLSVNMREQLAVLVRHRQVPAEVLVREILAEELEAQAALMRGELLRKYLYR